MRLTACVAALASAVACGGGSSGGGFALWPVDPSAPPAAEGPQIRQTTTGKVEGVDDSKGSGTYFWKGLPYAQAPVGDLRWRAPAVLRPWEGVRSAKTFGSACLQIGRMFGPGAHNRFDATIGTTMGQPLGSEDCLFANIWRPATDEKNLPVLVFVHGGSNISGYTADPLYDGATLAKAANAVVVTVSYRLGVLGFLNMPALRTGSGNGEDSGNFALLDLLAALRWLQHNVAAFGGDAGNVTLSGESAGATNLLALMASPLSRGLFHKAIEMSGGISLASNLPEGAMPLLQPAAASAAQGQAILARLLIADGTVRDADAAKAYLATRSAAQIASYLRAQDGGALLETVHGAGLGSVAPIPDGQVLPTDPIGAMAANAHNRVPLLAGTTRDEGKLFAPLLATLGGKPGWIVDDQTRFAMMFANDPEAVPRLTVEDLIDASYLPVEAPKTGYNAMTAVLTRASFEANRDNLLDTLRRHQPDVWSYRFDWAQQPAPWNDVYGAAHAFDLPFVFGNFGLSVIASVSFNTANRPGRLALSQAVMASVGAFLRTGDPNHPALGATWQPWPASLRLDASATEARIRAVAAP
ncbi:carboxylesterase/lipase family protein [Xenophilus sp. Marseille-Q4582]|uniref:carboxylesterase/lipase family protein n=1 Tax=Xenophilus sp. Marseille-Q4582 TaxID=2866600 RepID=UPI001CE46057|nr:carboxylesterase family protein [Xenophilus sp. Marseille-Q4582]